MKEIAVIGLGKFGKSVAENYANAGGMVLAIDWDADKIQEISGTVTYAVRADVTDAEVMRTLGLSNMDAAIVAIADNLEASIMATILLKEDGVPYVIAKAQNDAHAKVLRKVGVDKVIFPEKEMGVMVARGLRMASMAHIVDLSDEYSIIEVNTPKGWVGRSLLQLDLRKKYGINIVGIRQNNVMDMNVSPRMPLSEDMQIVVICRRDQIDEIFSE